MAEEKVRRIAAVRTEGVPIGAGPSPGGSLPGAVLSGWGGAGAARLAGPVSLIARPGTADHDGVVRQAHEKRASLGAESAKRLSALHEDFGAWRGPEQLLIESHEHAAHDGGEARSERSALRGHGVPRSYFQMPTV